MTDRGWFKIPMFCASVVLVSISQYCIRAHILIIWTWMLQVTSLFLVAQCSTLWQLILCQGFAIGGSGGFIFLPSLSIVPQWFDKRRGRAYGVVALGSSFGGTILPIILRKLLTSVGFQWTIRVLAFIILALMIVVNLTVRLRVKTPKRDRIVVPLSALFKIRSLMVRGVSLNQRVSFRVKTLNTFALFSFLLQIYRVGLTAVWMGLVRTLPVRIVKAALSSLFSTNSTCPWPSWTYRLSGSVCLRASHFTRLSWPTQLLASDASAAASGPTILAA